MEDPERLLWAMLAESERRMAKDKTLDEFEANVEIRHELVKCGVNLDDLGAWAQDQVAEVVEATKERALVRQKNHEESQALMDKAISILDQRRTLSNVR